MKRLLAAMLLMAAVLVSGCSSTSRNDSSSDTSGDLAPGIDEASGDSGSDIEENRSAEAGADRTAEIIPSEMFSDRDYEVGYDESESAIIQLNGDSADCSSDAVQISGSTVTITDEGTYILSGTLDDGMIIVNTDKSNKVQLVFNNVNIHSETCAPVYILQADKVFISLAKDTANTLSNGGTFEAVDENNIDAVIFSKEDLTLNGSGTLVVTSPAGHGIVSKDSLKFTSGIYDINCASHAVVGKDDVCIANAVFTIVSGKDGIHGDNADDASLGFVYIQSGTFCISAEGDGISASSCLQIEDGSFEITAGGGSVNAAVRSSDNWGDFRGGGSHKGGRMDNQMGEAPIDTAEAPIGTAEAPIGTAEDTTDSTSMKGMKAAADLTVNGGTFTIDSADDAVHSNSSVTVNGGTFEIASGDDAFHADEALAVTAGTIHITECYEGLEGLHVSISGGDISLVSTDDGLNAAGGMDFSGNTGGRDGMFGHGDASASNGSITISGGTLNITASSDGIDANGTIEITGGSVIVSGPAQGDGSVLDYDVSATISGGVFIGTGASGGMAQTFGNSEQGVISVSISNQAAGAEITLADGNGNVVLTYTPDYPFTAVILSSPDIISGETYTITVGSASGEFTAS